MNYAYVVMPVFSQPRPLDGPITDAEGYVMLALLGCMIAVLVAMWRSVR